MLPIISRCKFLGCHDSKRNIASHSSVAHLHFQIFEGRALIPIVVAHCLDRHCNSDFTRPSHLLANLKKFYYSYNSSLSVLRQRWLSSRKSSYGCFIVTKPTEYKWISCIRLYPEKNSGCNSG